MKPLQPVPPGARLALGVGFFVVFVAVWAAATLGGFVSPTFLADPLTMLRSGWTLLAEMGFARDIGMTVWRVVGGFLIAAALALPLGVAMGAYKPVEAFFEPFVSFARYLPASAFIPLLILWAGIGELQKLLVIFIGSFFQIVLMVAVTVGATRRDLVEAAYTLGASARGVSCAHLPERGPVISGGRAAKAGTTAIRARTSCQVARMRRRTCAHLAELQLSSAGPRRRRRHASASAAAPAQSA